MSETAAVVVETWRAMDERTENFLEKAVDEVERMD